MEELNRGFWGSLRALPDWVGVNFVCTSCTISPCSQIQDLHNIDFWRLCLNIQWLHRGRVSTSVHSNPLGLLSHRSNTRQSLGPDSTVIPQVWEGVVALPAKQTRDDSRCTLQRHLPIIWTPTLQMKPKSGTPVVAVDNGDSAGRDSDPVRENVISVVRLPDQAVSS
jgi:hypothetical protein